VSKAYKCDNCEKLCKSFPDSYVHKCVGSNFAFHTSIKKFNGKEAELCPSCIKILVDEVHLQLPEEIKS
jgi:hypothetical protein